MDLIILLLLLGIISTDAHVLPWLKAPRLEHLSIISNRTVFSLKDMGFETLTPRGSSDANEDIMCEKCPRRRCQGGFYRSQDDCECKECPPGLEANLRNDGCQPKVEKNDKQGQCPPGGVLDPAEGKQDKNTPQPKCIPDDSTLCQNGEVPASREKNDREPKSEAACAKDIDEKDKPKCKSNEYRHVQVMESETSKSVVYSCRKTQQFARDKESRFEETIPRKKAEFDEDKRRKEEERKKEEQRKKEEEEQKKEEEKRKKEEEERKRVEKEEKEREDEKNNKKIRMGKCLTIVPLSFFAGVTEFEYSESFFDMAFVSSDELMQYWPAELPTVPTASIDTEEYMTKFLEAINKDSWIVNHIGHGRRSTEVRDGVALNISTNSRSHLHHPHEERAIQLIPGLVAAIGNFLLRLGPILIRLGVGASRLGRLLRRGGVKLAEAGKSLRTVKEMRDGARAIANSKNWRNCLEGLAPVP